MQNDKVKILFLHGLGQNKESFDKTIKNINFKDIENIDLIPKNSKDLTFFDIADRLENKIKSIKKTNNYLWNKPWCYLSYGIIF